MSNTPTAPSALLLSSDDNVAVACRAIEAGSAIDVAGRTVLVRDAIASGHKLAVAPIANGAVVRKYGHPIGVASADIAVGEHVHVHNLQMVSACGDLAVGSAYQATPLPTTT